MNKRIAALLALLLGGFVALMLFVVLPTSRVNAPAAVTGNGISSAPLLTDMQRIFIAEGVLKIPAPLPPERWADESFTKYADEQLGRK